MFEPHRSYETPPSGGRNSELSTAFPLALSGHAAGWMKLL
jgi:hypothetical protein